MRMHGVYMVHACASGLTAQVRKAAGEAAAGEVAGEVAEDAAGDAAGEAAGEAAGAAAAHEEPRDLVVSPDLAVSPLATQQVVIDPIGPAAVALKAPNEHPHARKPVAEHDHAGDEAHHAQRGVRHADAWD